MKMHIILEGKCRRFMKKTKIIIDILMYLLFIILMGHHITENLIHEILGTTLFVLFIVHNILNYKYYKTIFKGKYTLKRTVIFIIDLLLLTSMIAMIISAINISNNVFAFLNISSKIWGRKLHMLSTSWGFVLMSIHLGLHLKTLINKINNKMKNSILEYLYYFVVLLIIIYGIYSFIRLNFVSDMFLMNAFKYYDFSESPVIFYLHVISASLFISLIIYFINNIKRKKDKNE